MLRAGIVTIACFLGTSLIQACSSSSDGRTSDGGIGTGGSESSGAGGAPGAGGRRGTGGAPGAGGAPGTGGATGGTPGTGGATATGGAPGAGGTTGSGGITATGGTPGTGGAGPATCAGPLTVPEAVVTSRDVDGAVVETRLPCEWQIPSGPVGVPFSRTHLNVLVTPSGGTAQTIGHVPSSGACGDGWYYDDEVRAKAPGDAGTDAGRGGAGDASVDASGDSGGGFGPTRIILCATTCDALLAASGSRVDVMFGCPTLDAP